MTTIEIMPYCALFMALIAYRADRIMQRKWHIWGYGKIGAGGVVLSFAEQDSFTSFLGFFVQSIGLALITGMYVVLLHWFYQQARKDQDS